MPTSAQPQTTDFTRDILGRYVCNGLDEALRTTDRTLRPDARPFDIIVLGGGTFGAAFAQHLLAQDKTHSHRILVLEGGPLAIPEHVQNLPNLGLNPPPPTSIADLRQAGQDRAARNEVWGLAWHSDVPTGFPGLAYCVGGRSLYWGGWSPRPIATELSSSEWPASTVQDLTNRYFDEASTQLGLTETNDFIHGALHEALRQVLHDAIAAGQITAAVPFAELPQVVQLGFASGMAAAAGAASAAGGSSAAATDLLKLEAPLAVQSRATRSGFFPTNKFSAVPLLMKAARAAFSESQGDDFRKRLMIVPNCHVKALVPSVNGGGLRVTRVDTNLGPIAVEPDAAVVSALGTIESTRLALLLLDTVPAASKPNLPIGRNLIAHLRSNLDIRIPREALSSLPASLRELQASALLFKGRHQFADGSFGHFHLQITACGLGKTGANSEAELFQKVPDIDGLRPFDNITDSHVVITIRGIGEMEPQNSGSFVSLDPEPDEFGMRRAFVRITPSAKDNELWNVMDQAADDVAAAFGGTQGFEVLGKRRDGLGTTHHEAGTLALHAQAGKAVCDADCKMNGFGNVFAAGPAVFPTTGSPNPMLTGVALSRRLADKLAAGPTVPVSGGFQAIFDGADLSSWRMTTIRNQPGRDNPGRFELVEGTLESVPGTDLGVFWHTKPAPPDFLLELEFRLWQPDANSGVFVRFPDPESKGYNNAAFVPVDFGFEVQIDELGRPDGAGIHTTGAIYAQPSQTFARQPLGPVGQWNQLAVRVQGQTYTVLLNGQQTAVFQNNQAGRGQPSAPGAPSFVGLQTHTGRVAFRNLRIKAL